MTKAQNGRKHWKQYMTRMKMRYWHRRLWTNSGRRPHGWMTRGTVGRIKYILTQALSFNFQFSRVFCFSAIFKLMIFINLYNAIAIGELFLASRRHDTVPARGWVEETRCRTIKFPLHSPWRTKFISAWTCVRVDQSLRLRSCVKC